MRRALVLGALLLAGCTSSVDPRTVDWDEVVQAAEPCSRANRRPDHPVAYGDLDGDGRDEAAVSVSCVEDEDRAVVVFRLAADGPSVVGLVRPRPPEPTHQRAFFDGAGTSLGPDGLTVTERWWGTQPITATTRWAFDGDGFVDPVTESGPTPPPPGQDLAGGWGGHARGLEVRADGTATMSTRTYRARCEPFPPGCGSVRYELSVEVDDDRRGRAAAVTGVEYTSEDGERTVAVPDDPVVGRRFRLELVEPGLLVTTGGPLDGAYWCGEGLDRELGFLCGA